MTGGRRRLHTAFLVVTGLIGWAAMVWAARGLRVPPAAELEAAALFLGVVAGARALAFPLPGGRRRLARHRDLRRRGGVPRPVADGDRRGVGARRRRHARARGCPTRSTSAASRARCSPAGRTCSASARAVVDRDVWLVPGAGRRVLAVALRAAGAARVARRRARSKLALKRNTYSVIAEATLLPLASAIVLIWEPRRPVPFALLGGTYLLVNYGFKRLADLAATCGGASSELETLNRTAHALGGTLETPALLAALLRETARALPLADRIDAMVEIDGELVRYRLARGELSVAPADGARAAALTVDGGAARRRRARRRRARRARAHDRAAHHVRRGHRRAGRRVERRRGVRAQSSCACSTPSADRRRRPSRTRGCTRSPTSTGSPGSTCGATSICACRRRSSGRGASAPRSRWSCSTSTTSSGSTTPWGTSSAIARCARWPQLAERQLRGVDLAARYGGEELAFLLPRTSLADAHAVAERIREAIATHDFDGLHITASLGVAGWTEAGVDRSRAARRARRRGAVSRQGSGQEPRRDRSLQLRADAVAGAGDAAARLMLARALGVLVLLAAAGCGDDTTAPASLDLAQPILDLRTPGQACGATTVHGQLHRLRAAPRRRLRHPLQHRDTLDLHVRRVQRGGDRRRRCCSVRRRLRDLRRVLRIKAHREIREIREIKTLPERSAWITL